MKNLAYSVPIALMTFLPSCEPENEPPTAKLEVSPIYGEIPVDVRMKVTGQDPDGIGDIKQYVLYIGNESVKSSTPIDITRTFTNEGKVNIYGEVIDSESQSNKTPASQLELTLTEGIEQSAALANENEIAYSATLKKVPNAELIINKNGILFLKQSITDNSQTGPDYQKTFKYNPDGLTKGNYEFILKSGTLEKKTNVEIPNYKPTLNLSGVNTEVMEGTEISVDLTGKASDKNPEDNLNIPINSVTSLDGKTQVSLNGNIAKIKALWDKIGAYQVRINFGSTVGGLEEAVLSGNITDDPRWIINPFVQPNDSTLNWYGSGDVNKDNVLNSQDITKIIEIINGTYSNPSDTRLKDRADVNGDEVVNNSDRQLLENRVNGVINYLPGEWNKLTTKAERVDWLTKMLEIDKTDELQYIPGEWVCGDFARQIVINFHGFTELGFDENLGLKDNGRFNIPVNYLLIIPRNVGTEAHAINITYTGDNIDILEDGTCSEPQTDWIVTAGMYTGFPANCEAELKMPYNKNELQLIGIRKFNIENSISSLIWENEDPNINIIKHR